MASDAHLKPVEQKYQYRKQVIWLICILSLLRLLVAGTLELTNDEAYYWLYSQQLQWNYFDHPPLVALWIRIFTANLLTQETFFLRLGSVTALAFSSWFIYQTVSTLYNERAGLFAVFMLQSSFYAGITAGIYIMPDTPQLFFWTLSMWMLSRILRNPDHWKNWILFGLASGLCIMSKVHGVFIWFGLGSYVLFLRPSWLRNPRLYLALFIALVLASPIFFWNLHYDFMTWRFHSNRVSLGGEKWNPNTFFHELASQAGFNNPVNVCLIVLGMFHLTRKGKMRSAGLQVFLFTGVLLALALLLMSIWRPTLTHWSGPAYVALLPLGAVYLAERFPGKNPKILKWSLAGHILILYGWLLAVNFFPGTTGDKNDQQLGHGDLTLDMYGWREAGAAFAQFYQEGIQSGEIKKNTPVVCRYWWGAHIEYFFCRPAHAAMIGLGPVTSIHYYAWMNKVRKDSVSMDEAFCIIPSDEILLLPRYKIFYRQAELVKSIKILRSGKPAHNFNVYRLRGWIGTVPFIQ